MSRSLTLFFIVMPVPFKCLCMKIISNRDPQASNAPFEGKSQNISLFKSLQRARWFVRGIVPARSKFGFQTARGGRVALNENNWKVNHQVNWGKSSWRGGLLVLSGKSEEWWKEEEADDGEWSIVIAEKPKKCEIHDKSISFQWRDTQLSGWHQMSSDCWSRKT